jgi:hypothetical protein
MPHNDCFRLAHALRYHILLDATLVVACDPHRPGAASVTQTDS